MIMSETIGRLNRRVFIAGIAGLSGMAIMGCSRSPQNRQSQGDAASNNRTEAKLASMTVYRDPSCGCCEAWADIAKNAGYQITLVDRPDMPAVKARLGVPEALASCHTATVGGYAVEGHVPLEDVARLLKERPKTIRGIAVAGMPRGSPGMEMPDGLKDAFQVMAFDAAGNASIYRV